MYPEDPSYPDGRASGSRQPAGDPLLERLRSGQAEAGEEFVREHYAGVYRYLLYLTGRPEWAEDLTQQTFLQAWRHLDRFVPGYPRSGWTPLRAWLHRIAHREFLQSLRSEKPLASLEEIGELPAPPTAPWTDAVELRALLSELPLPEREVVLLHDLEGYTAAEIAAIVDAPVTTVNYRLRQARSRLRRELGEGDLAFLNEPAVPMRQWGWLPLDEMHALETRLGRGRCSVFGVRSSEPCVPNTEHPTPNARSEATTEETMERREFLRQAAVGAAGLMLSEPEKEVVDSRLTQKVTCAFKGTALSDLCEKLKSDTGVAVAAGPSVADEKVTLFCEKRPLRDLMRQLSRPFGYTWLRSGKTGEYRYELVQDLRSQLLEEELRNRDRNAALLALEKEIDRFRPYLSLSPDEALAKAKTAAAAEKPLLETLAGVGWGPIQMYFRLSPQQQAALRAGQTLTFSDEPGPGQYPIPSDVARGVLQSNRTWRVVKRDDGGFNGSLVGDGGTFDPKSVPLTAVPEVRAQMSLTLSQSELGQFTLGGTSGFFAPPGKGGNSSVNLSGSGGPYAVGTGPGSSRSEGRTVSSERSSDPALRQRISVQPQPSCNLSPPPAPRAPGSADTGEAPERQGEAQEPKVTTADVLEGLHRSTGMPIIADFYTRLYKPEAVSVKDRPLLDALNHLAEAMRLRWNKDADWLQFRSNSYYHDRLKEVPNRLLSRWAAARRLHGWLALDDLAEIAQLPDAQLDGAEMAEGAKACWGLREWDLARDGNLRPHVRYLAEFTPAQRQAMTSSAGLPFIRMPLAQQRKFLEYALSGQPLQSLEELAGATLRVDYTHPGWYQWLKPDDFTSRRWAVSLEPGPKGRRELMPPVRERTREAALEAARRLFPPVTDAMADAYRRYGPDMTAAKLIPQPEQIAPTELDLVIVYIPGATNAHPVRWWRVGQGLADG